VPAPTGSPEPQPTLVLTQGYAPFRVVNWRRAIKLLLLGKAEMLSSYEGSYLRSAWEIRPVPAVIRVLNGTGYAYHNQRVRLHREFLYARDNYRCQYCGEKFPTAELTYDHVEPKSRGGQRSWENLVAACKSCNQKKDRHTPSEAKMALRRTPRRPAWLPPILLNSWGRRLPAEWDPYVRWVLKD
jgi:5-methylcytosine-specific restriction endonuclease McrA